MSPMITMPTMTMLTCSACPANCTSQPSPLLAAISSAATRQVHATPMPTRMAVKISGSAEGRITLRKICAWLAPSVRATDTRSGGVLFTPEMVPMMITGMVPTRIRMAFGNSPMPNHTTSSGM